MSDNIRNGDNQVLLPICRYLNVKCQTLVIRCCDGWSRLTKGRAGFPAQIVIGGRSCKTTEPAPTTVPVPIVTPWITTQFAAIHTSFSMTIGFPMDPCRLSYRLSMHSHRFLWIPYGIPIDSHGLPMDHHGIPMDSYEFPMKSL